MVSKTFRLQHFPVVFNILHSIVASYLGTRYKQCSRESPWCSKACRNTCPVCTSQPQACSLVTLFLSLPVLSSLNVKYISV